MRSILSAVIIGASISGTSAGDTCTPSFWSPGHDYKNKQYSNTNATSAADCCSKCAVYQDKTIGQCKFWTWDGKSTCWLKSNNEGYRTACKTCVCGGVANVGPPAPPPPPPATPAPPAPLPTPPTQAPTQWDGKPVQVYIMMGQSNMLGEAKILGAGATTLESAVFKQGKFPYLKTGNTWSVYPNMRNVFIMGNGNGTFKTSVLQHNEWLTPDYGAGADDVGRGHTTMGPEFGIANFGGSCSATKCSQQNVMLLKSCIGDRALGWDLLPPGTARHDFTDSKGNTYTYAGSGDSPEKWIKNQTKPAPSKGWYAGAQWDGDTRNEAHVIDTANLGTFFPGANKYEIAGFFWWQGDRDSRDEGLASAYEANLVQLIKELRKTFNAPNAPFVTASLGQTVLNSTGADGKILEANLNVGCNGETQGAQTKCKYPEFKGNVAAIYTHPLENTPGSSGGHYGDDAITYMNVGLAMGAAMAKMKGL